MYGVVVYVWSYRHVISDDMVKENHVTD